MKKGFTLIELIIATIIISFIYVLIASNYKEQYNAIDKFKEKVESISLWQQWYNCINYLFISREIKLEKKYKQDLINGIISNNQDTELFLENWIHLWLWMFFDNWAEIIPNNVPNNSYWTLIPDNKVNGEILWGFTRIKGPKDTDHMQNIDNFNLVNTWKSIIGPFYYVNIQKEDTWVKYKWKTIYKLKLIEHFIFKTDNKDYTYSFIISPLNKQ